MPARLRPVTESPRRALGVVRVSKERDEMVSPEIQWTAITDHCTRRGYQLVGRIEGIDESGSRRRSPWWAKLDQAVGQVEAGDVDVIVVWRFDRTARNRLRWNVALDRVDVAGGAIESATEPIDTTTASGRFARGMLGEMAAYRAEEIGSVWRDVHARRTRAGLPANGKPRFGYDYTDGKHRPSPDTGSVLAALYRRYIAGESAYALVEWLNREGIRTAPGYSTSGPGAWTQRTLRRVLDSGFGAGLLTVAGEHIPGAHEPVIDERTWAAYQVARAARRTLRRSERSQYLLSGMVRCMVDVDGQPCGSSMGGGQFGNGHVAKFRCIAAHAERRHPGGYVTMRVVEDAVRAWLQDVADEVDETTGQVTPASSIKRDADALAREISDLEQQLVTLSVQLARRIVPESVYEAARDQILAEQRRLRGQHDRALVAVQRVDAGPIAAVLVKDWDVEALTTAEKRAFVRKLLARVEVTPGRPKATITLVPAW
ncbi:MAG: recombinase family protein [Jatrophihabitans sp.]|uniref:recombinase family protein n=1 Tax=Jatrophihabitans sp. TaxID=1932789 RepID=UPI003F81A26B